MTMMSKDLICEPRTLRTHNLSQLMNYLSNEMGMEIPLRVKRDINALNNYYFNARYPGDNSFFVSKDDIEICKEGLDSCRELVLSVDKEMRTKNKEKELISENIPIVEDEEWVSNMKKQILSIIMAGCLLLSMTACSSDKKNTKSASEQTTADTSTSTNSPQEYSKTDFVMSTVLSEKIYGTKDVTQDIKEELDKLEKEQLSWREDSSIVSKINADAQKGTKTKLDSDMTSWVEDSLELAKRSNGAFDPTIGRLTRLWNIEGDNPKVPSKQEIKNTLKDTGYTKIHLEKVENPEYRYY